MEIPNYLAVLAGVVLVVLVGLYYTQDRWLSRQAMKDRPNVSGGAEFPPGANPPNRRPRALSQKSTPVTFPEFREPPFSKRKPTMIMR